MSEYGSSTKSMSFDLLNYTTGINTPRDSHLPLPGPGVLTMFPLRFHDIYYEFPLTVRNAQYLETHGIDFLSSLSSLELSETGDDDDNKSLLPRSTAALALQFLEFLLNRDISTTIISELFRVVRAELNNKNDDVHDFISHLPDSPGIRRNTLRTYLRLRAIVTSIPKSRPSALFSAAAEGDASVLMAFGGQGAMNPICVDELAELFSVYKPLVETLMIEVGGVLSTLSRHLDTESFYCGREINLLEWMNNPPSRPEKGFIATAAVSFPMIGLIDLMHYCVVCRMLEKEPGEVRDVLHGVTGHSQGTVIAAAVAMSDTWESFFSAAKWAVELLFWTGLECHKGAPQSRLSPLAVRASVEKGQGTPSHLLAVRGLERQQLEKVMTSLNVHHVGDGETLQLALVNGPKSLVVAGTPRSLLGFTRRLDEIRAPDGLDQSRIPFSKRKPVVFCHFLPTSAPFHSTHLESVTARLKARFSATGASQSFTVDRLGTSVFHTETGFDIRDTHSPTENVALILIDAIATRLVDWPRSLQTDSVSHIIVFGGGRLNELVDHVADGRGIRVIDATTLTSKAELFMSNLTSWKLQPKPWKDEYRPRLHQTASGDVVLETRLNDVLNTPPIITGGMTPTTVAWDFCSAVINAGYHVELAGGGYRNAKEMSDAIEKLASSIPRGRAITCNLIYASPAAMKWQIPMLRQLIRRGVPIDGLTIGAGIPSAHVAAEYVETLGLKHISFKPGSLTAIREVVAIAKTHPSLPIILQWTGGRGGGHHSYEDFHDPVLETYSDIRRCGNLYLVVGSGFGDSAGIYPYLSGDWALEFGRPAMPCDGVLLGSRMMVASEAHTSSQAKALILKASGVTNSGWEDTYTSAAGGVLTVTSEMGQPIHKLATRAVQFWKEMDDSIFSLPIKERKNALLKRKDEIIRRLNADFAKPWFGKSSTGQAVDLEDMSYGEVLSRLIELMYVQNQKRWIDPSYRDLVEEFAVQTLARLACSSSFDPSCWPDVPGSIVTRMVEACPDVKAQLLHPEDVRFLVNSCRVRGRKPVPFILALDDDFEYWFKKDSLWQSEDVDAVVDQDPERVCILQSPVSVRYSTRDDQTAKDILSNIHNGLVALARKDQSPSNEAISAEDEDEEEDAQTKNIAVEDTETHMVFRPLADKDSELPQHQNWLACLSRNTSASIAALLGQNTVLGAETNRRQPNPFYRVFAPQQGFSVHVGRDKFWVYLVDDSNGSTSVSVSCHSENRITINLHYSASSPSDPATLTFDWTYDLQSRCLTDCTKGQVQRVQEFYARLWLGRAGPVAGRLMDTFRGDEIILTKQLHQKLHSVISAAFKDGPTVHAGCQMPMEAAVIASWAPLMKPLLIADLQVDLLSLVHRTMEITYMPGVFPLQVDDAVSAESSVRSILIEPTGKSVTVQANLVRKGQLVARLVSEFFIKGDFSDYTSMFRLEREPEVEHRVDSPIQEAILRDREWVSLLNEAQHEKLEGMVLIFELHTMTTWKDATTFASVRTTGNIHQKLWNGTKRLIGSVAFETGESCGNPVMEFLTRKGKVVDGRVSLKEPGWADVENQQQTVTMPLDSQPYAAVSRDCNPIHVSPVFAALAGLPGPITHGMYTAAVCRKVVEDVMAEGVSSRLRSFRASFVGMVRPGDELTVRVTHKAMQKGLMIVDVIAQVAATREKVLEGEATVELPATAYVFTGQGTQFKGMGMALYESSPVARKMWDEMDRHLFDQFGWSILDMVQTNPKQLTVHFRGAKGRKVLENYLAMKTEVRCAETGSRRLVPVIPGLTKNSTSYTFSDPKGLLHTTQFAQPAVLLLEKATMEDMKAHGLVSDDSMFAGHSLGEWGALYSLAEFVEFRHMLSIGVYRGLLMQFAVPRDDEGRTGYAMVATNPGRVGKYFDEDGLRALVDQISRESGHLLEIVNFNVEGEQYVCAGHVRNVYCLTEVLNVLSKQANDIGSHLMREFLVAAPSSNLHANNIATTALGRQISKYVEIARGLLLDKVELRRGKATIPLEGIDMPFHSQRLRPGIGAFRKFLRNAVKAEHVRPDAMVGKWIPNVVGKPFSLDASFVEAATEATASHVLKELATQVS